MFVDRGNFGKERVFQIKGSKSRVREGADEVIPVFGWIMALKGAINSRIFVDERIFPCGKVERYDDSKTGELEMIVILNWLILRPEKEENSSIISQIGLKESGEEIKRDRSSAVTDFE